MCLRKGRKGDMKRAKVTKDTANREAVSRIRAAADEVCRRCDEISAVAENPKDPISSCFALGRAVRINDSCAEFILAVAESTSNADILAAKASFESLKKHTARANQGIAARLGENRDMLDGVACCEETMLRLLAEGDPTVRIVAKFAAQHQTLIRVMFLAALNSIRKQLEQLEHRGEVKVHAFSFKAIQQLIGAIRGRPNGKAEALAFMRTLYDSDEPDFNSCHKVVDFVRNCKDVRDPYFSQCVRIRALVKGSAKKVRGGEERFWRSLAQELKPSHAKCRKPKSQRQR